MGMGKKDKNRGNLLTDRTESQDRDDFKVYHGDKDRILFEDGKAMAAELASCCCSDFSEFFDPSKKGDFKKYRCNGHITTIGDCLQPAFHGKPNQNTMYMYEIGQGEAYDTNPCENSIKVAIETTKKGAQNEP